MITRPSIEVDCRLEVIGDLIALRHTTSRRAIAAALAALIPSLGAHVDELDDNTDPGAPIPAHLKNEIRFLAS